MTRHRLESQRSQAHHAAQPANGDRARHGRSADPPLGSARHPLVVIGNAIISIFVLLAVVAGVVLFIGKQRFEAPGPLPQDRIVNIPRGSGIRDIADV